MIKSSKRTVIFLAVLAFILTGISACGMHSFRQNSQAVNLVRYFLESNNQQNANDVLLTSLSKQMNPDNFENKDSLFQNLVTKSNTNITVRDYSAADDGITVLCNSQNGISVYGAEIKYKKNKITKDTLQNAKGYFVK